MAERNRLIIMYTTSDHSFENDIAITKINPESINEYLDAMLSFLKAAGFDFVNGLAVVDDEGNITWQTER